MPLNRTSVIPLTLTLSPRGEGTQPPRPMPFEPTHDG